MATLSIHALRAMVRKDLLLFFGDRRSVIISFLVPIVIASFFGSLFGGSKSESERTRVPVAIVDQDSSAIARGFVSSMQTDSALAVSTPTLDAARDAVRRGKITVALVIPRGFGDSARQAFFGTGVRPEIELLYDPSHAIELAMVRGVMVQYVMQAVTGGGPRRITMPYTSRATAVTSGPAVSYNGYAHSFAGMAIQFLLFAMANMGIEMLLERQRGLWKRLRSAPISKLTLLGSKAVSGAVISLLILLVSFGFAMLVFGVRVQGSLAGFFGVAIACALMASTFGLLVAAVGNTPATARGVTTFAVLIMVMLGGAWVPSFVFPAWLQQATQVLPVRWAVDGFDAMTWRGLGVASAAMPVVVLLGFALAFGALAVARFRWQDV